MSNNKQSSDHIPDVGKKVSSVEWFAEQTLNAFITKEKYDELLEQAKAMHKEECKESYYESLLSNFQNFEQFYNETFNNHETN